MVEGTRWLISASTAAGNVTAGKAAACAGMGSSGGRTNDSSVTRMNVANGSAQQEAKLQPRVAGRERRLRPAAAGRA
jgi:hypothetical protein